MRSTARSSFFCLVLLASVRVGWASAAGDLDPHFGSGGWLFGSQGAVEFVQPDGRIVLRGATLIDRRLPDGALDPAFGGGSSIPLPGHLTKAMLQGDGKIVVVGWDLDGVGNDHDDIRLWRFEADGTPDAGFGTAGGVSVTALDAGLLALVQVYDAVIDAAGRIVVAGSTSASLFDDEQIAIVRFESDGGLDGTFGTNGGVILNLSGPGSPGQGISLGVQSGGALLAGVVDDGQGNLLVRLDAAGALDGTFGTGGVTPLPADMFPADVIVQPDDTIVLGGQRGSSPFESMLTRLLPDGGIDPTFGTAGTAILPEADGQLVPYSWQGAIQQADGKLVTKHPLARFTADGLLDATFGSGGFALDTLLVGPIALAPDGAIIGNATRPSTPPGMLARYFGGTCGDGASDAGEQCDDGNTLPGDGCEASCCLVDTDGDGQCDVIDDCVGGVAAVKAKVKLTPIAPPGKLRRDRVTAQFVLPGATLDPPAEGLRVVLREPDEKYLDVTIPPGPEWVTASSATALWTWEGFVIGFHKLKLLEKKTSPGTFKLTMKRLHEEGSPTLLPLSMTIVPSGAASGDGECVEALFPGAPAPACIRKTGPLNELVICR